MLWTEEGVESGKGEGLSVEVGGVGLEGAAIADCGGECGTLWEPVGGEQGEA